MGKTKKQLADEAYRRVVEQPQQVDLLEQIALEELEAKGPPPDITGRLSHCPECKRQQSLAWGWTPLPDRLHDHRIQCGNCGHVFAVAKPDYDRLVADIRAYGEQQRAKLAPLPKRAAGSKRARGGG